MKLGADEYAGEHGGEKLPGSGIVHLSKQADYIQGLINGEVVIWAKRCEMNMQLDIEQWTM